MPSPTSWSNVTPVSQTGVPHIDALLSGARWGSSTITYSFPGKGSIWSTSVETGYGPSSGTREPWNAFFAPLSSPGAGNDQTYFTSALQEWANVANLNFVLVADIASNVGDIRAAYSYQADKSTHQAWAYYPDNASYSGDLWFNLVGTSGSEAWTSGTYENMTVLHELGHALGLKHDFEALGTATTVLSSSSDTRSYTIMSYSAQPGIEGTRFSYEPTTPMLFDIVAIQYLYGVNYSYHAGNDTHLFTDATTYHQTIWDGAGIDTIQYAGNANSAIDLRPGYGSDIGRDVYQRSVSGVNLQSVKNVWIAYGVTIENATGGDGSDTITGNDFNNSLNGGSGNDTLLGAAGNDTFDWDSDQRGGNDIFYGGTGNDTFVLDSPNDGVIEYSNEGIDTVWVSFTYSVSNLPNVENLRAFGSIGVTLTGNTANNSFAGSSGNDTLDGGSGFDRAAFNGYRANNVITKVGSSFSVRDTTGTDGTDTLTNIERLQFADAKIALDITGNRSACFDTAGLANAGQVYRLYEAMFNRAPDQAGLAYWIGQADVSIPLTTIATTFASGQEFQNRYGSLGDHAFIDQLYLNVLGRAGEAAGTAYWYGQLDTAAMSREQVLVGFSESTENQAAVIGVIQNGIDFTV